MSAPPYALAIKTYSYTGAATRCHIREWNVFRNKQRKLENKTERKKKQEARGAEERRSPTLCDNSMSELSCSHFLSSVRFSFPHEWNSCCTSEGHLGQKDADVWLLHLSGATERPLVFLLGERR